MLLAPDDARGWMVAMAAAVALDIPASSREGVAAQLALNHRLVLPLLCFDLPADVMPAPPVQP